MPTELQELKEQKESIHTELVLLSDGLEEGATFTAEQLTQWDAHQAEIERIDSEIATAERLLSLSVENEGESGSGDGSTGTRRFSPSIITRSRTVDHAAAVRGWALSQLNRREFITSDMSNAQRAANFQWDAPIQGAVKWDQTVGSATGGANSVNDAVVGEVIRKMKDYGGMMEACHVFSTSDGTPLKKPVHDSTAFKAAKTAELGTISNTTQVVDKVTFQSMELTSGIYETSLQLVRDSAYDIMGEFTMAIGESFARGANEYLTTGDQPDEPQGIENAVTAIAPTVINYANMLALYHSVDASYRRSAKCGWMMNDTTLLSVKQNLLDADGRPIYKTSGSAVDGFGYTIEGKAVKVNTDLSDGVILFGDFDRYHVRLIGGVMIRVLNELFALRNAVGIVGHTAIDGRLVDNSAIRKLVVA